jgi:hypothetical protein
MLARSRSTAASRLRGGSRDVSRPPCPAGAPFLVALGGHTSQLQGFVSVLLRISARGGGIELVTFVVMEV